MENIFAIAFVLQRNEEYGVKKGEEYESTGVK